MAEYMPMALLRTKSYPAYQFLASLRYDGHTVGECMNYAIWTVMDWIRQKLRGNDLPEELLTPDSSNCFNASMDQFRSFHFHEGVHIDMTSLLTEGMWALHLKEPDSQTKDRSAVIGRFFITEVALKQEEDYVSLAVRVDVLDPLQGTHEVDYAFRPAFIRKLFSNKKLRIKQADLLRYDESYSVNNSHGLRHMMDVLKSQDNYMPSVIFTYSMEKRKVIDLVDTLDETLGLDGTEASFRNHLSTCSLVPDMLEFNSPVMPYDVEYVARHSFGYGRVYRIEPNQFRAFQLNLGHDIHMGDILWMEPVRYGGACHVIPFHQDESLASREQTVEKILKDLHCYSKHKLYDYKCVSFEDAVRRKETENRIHSMISELRQNNQQETQALYQETEALLELYDQEKRQMSEEIEKLKKENRDLSGKLMYMDGRLAKHSANAIIRVPEVRELYADEQYDLVVSVLRQALLTYASEDSRAYELLEGILKENELTGEGKELFNRIKNILYRNKNITESDEQDLRRLGFTVTKRTNGHYKLVFQDDPRYTFTLSGTASDGHSMKNAYAEIDAKMSVYK